MTDILIFHCLFLAVAGGLFWLCVALWRRRVLLRLLGVPIATPMPALFIMALLWGVDSLNAGPFGTVAIILACVYMAVLSLLFVLVLEMLID